MHGTTYATIPSRSSTIWKSFMCHCKYTQQPRPQLKRTNAHMVPPKTTPAAPPLNLPTYLAFRGRDLTQRQGLGREEGGALGGGGIAVAVVLLLLPALVRHCLLIGSRAGSVRVAVEERPVSLLLLPCVKRRTNRTGTRRSSHRVKSTARTACLVSVLCGVCRCVKYGCG